MKVTSFTQQIKSTPLYQPKMSAKLPRQLISHSMIWSKWVIKCFYFHNIHNLCKYVWTILTAKNYPIKVLYKMDLTFYRHAFKMKSFLKIFFSKFQPFRLHSMVIWTELNTWWRLRELTSEEQMLKMSLHFIGLLSTIELK